MQIEEFIVEISTILKGHNTYVEIQPRVVYRQYIILKRA